MQTTQKLMANRKGTVVGEFLKVPGPPQIRPPLKATSDLFRKLSDYYQSVLVC